MVDICINKGYPGSVIYIKNINMKKDRIRITIELNAELKESLEKTAKNIGASMSVLCRMAMIKFLKEHNE